MNALTLKQVVRREIRELQSKNPVLQEYRYRNIASGLNQIGRHKTFLIITVMLIYGITYLDPGCWISGGHIGLAVLHIAAFMPNERYFNINTIIATSQLTIVGVFFPIIIGLISVLFQSDQSRNVRLTVLMCESRVVEVGASGFFLVAVISVQFFAIDSIAQPNRFIATALNVIWFLVNLMGTVFFLWSAYRFLRVDTRPELIKQYIANLAWPSELIPIFSSQIYIQSADLGLLPSGVHIEGNSDKENAQSQTPRIEFSPYYSDSGEVCVTKPLRSETEFSNVWFWTLRYGLSRWLARSERVLRAKVRGRQQSSVLGDIPPSLRFSLVPGETYPKSKYFENRVIICRQIRPGDFPVSLVEKFIIRLSHRFNRKRRDARISETTEILQEFANNTLSLIDQRRHADFQDLLLRQEDMNSFLVSIAWTYDDENRPINYGEIGNLRFWSGSLSDIWQRPYRDIFSRAISAVHDDLSYFRSCAYVTPRLVSRMREFATPALKQKNLRLSSMLQYLLTLQWARDVAAQNTFRPDAWYAARLNAPNGQSHVAALRDFVGAWEQTLSRIEAKVSNPKDSSWEQQISTFDELRTHLNTTMLMLARSVWFGDEIGAYWMVDCLLNWRNSLDVRLGGHNDSVYGVDELDTHPGQFNLSWNQFTKQIRNELPDETLFQNQDEVFRICVSNFWQDCCLNLSIFLLEWGMRNESEDNLSLEISRMILDQEFYEPSSRSPRGNRLFHSIRDVFISLIRQIGSGHRWQEGAYRHLQNSTLGELSRVEERDWVSGRVYSSLGETVLSSLVLPTFLVLMSKSATRPASRFGLSQERLHRRNLEQPESVAEIRGYLEGMVEISDQMLADDYLSPFRKNLKRDVSQEEFVGLRDRMRSELQLLIEEIGKIQDDRESEADIDADLILELEHEISETAFTAGHYDFPISAFSHVSAIEDSLTEYSIRLRPYRRGYFTHPRLVDPPANNVEVISERAADTAAFFALNRMVKTLSCEEVETPGPEVFWETLKRIGDEISKNDMHPILLIQSPNAPRWISDWMWDMPLPNNAERPNDLNMRRDAEELDRSYVTHMNQIEVHSVRIRPTEAYILPKEALERIRFQQFENGQKVRAQFELDENSSVEGSLVVRWGMEIDLSEVENIKLFRLIFARGDIEDDK